MLFWYGLVIGLAIGVALEWIFESLARWIGNHERH